MYPLRWSLAFMFIFSVTLGCGPSGGTTLKKTDQTIVLDEEPELEGAEGG